MRPYLSEELKVSEILIRQGEELTPRFRVIGYGKDWHIFAPLSGDPAHDQDMLRHVWVFMAMKLTRSFVFSTQRPGAMVSAGVSRTSCAGLMQTIVRAPLCFGQPVELPRDEIGQEILSLLPARVSAITEEEFQGLKAALVSNAISIDELDADEEDEDA